MMRRSRPFVGTWFGGANLKLTVHSDRITVHDFAGEMFRKSQRQRSLSASRWADDYNQ
jgi:hypothetical protein